MLGRSIIASLDHIVPHSKIAAVLIVGLASLVYCSSASAQSEDDRPGRRIMIGTGIQTTPSYPGANGNSAGFLPLFDTWKDGEPLPVESPDEGFGFALIGSRNGIAAGPAMAIAATRASDAVPGLGKIGFGMEVGGFVEAWPVNAVRLRAELRQGIGGHKALLGDLAADFVWRSAATGESAVATLGPRLRWGSAKHNRAYFGIAGPAAGPVFAPFEPGSGIYAVGASAGLRLPLGRTFGLYSYAAYDRLTGASADSPIVNAGSPDQYSAGIALTYRFTL